MGMYDTIQMDDLRVVCAAGHHVCGELQTKDLDEGMATYVVHQGRAYRWVGQSAPISVPRTIEQGYLVIPHYAEPVALTRSIVAYASCKNCIPVLVLAQPGLPRWDMIREQHVWCEWRLTFHNGVLTEVMPVKAQTRDDLRRELRAGGALVLEDEDVVAKAHLALREKRERC